MKYTAPQFEIIKFDEESVITASAPTSTTEDDVIGSDTIGLSL